MGTVSKALLLIDILSGPEARLGLTEIARASGFDKATTRRLLVELKANGFVEQDETRRDYMLGPALLRFGRLREARFPYARIADPVVRALAEATGETAHASEYGGGVLASIAVQASDKSNRVIVELGEHFPLHATASGLAVLSASPAAVVDAVLAKALARFSDQTQTDPARIAALVEQTRARGYALSDQLKERGVHSVAAAIRSPTGLPVGAVAVAMPSVRATPDAVAKAGALVRDAAADIAAQLFGGRKGQA